jgi:dihydroxyacetone kinase-like protein
MAGREVASVVTNDEVGREIDLDDRPPRCCGYADRGKDVGTAAEIGMPIAALKGPAHALDGRGAMAVHRPAAGQPNFTLADNEMEMGVGIHGEPGRRRVVLVPADAIASEPGEAILKGILRRSRTVKCCCSSTGSAQRR